MQFSFYVITLDILFLDGILIKNNLNMKKITLLFTAMLFTSLTAFAQFSFPDAGPQNVVAGTPTVISINDAGNSAGASAGAYLSFSVSADWVAGGGNPWSTEADITVTTSAGGVLVDPPTTGGAASGDATTLTFEGEFLGVYDPSVDGTLDLVLGQSFGGSDADWTNIIVTILPAPTCGVALNLMATPTDISADFSWEAPLIGTATGYNWELQPDGVAQGTPDPVASGGTAGLTVNSGDVLTADTAYEFYVQVDCGATDGTSEYITIGFTTASGPAPANDDFANAIAVACGDMNIMGDTSNATLDEAGAAGGGGADVDSPNVWYFYDTAIEGEGDVTLDLCPSAYDTSVLVYTGTSGDLTFVAGNDDASTAVCGAGQGTRSQVTFTASGTNVYYIMIEGWNFTSTGIYDLSVSCVATTPPPANDLCGNAEVLTIGVPTDGTTVGATQTGGEEQPTCDTFGTIADVWYSVELAGASDLVITTTISGTSDQANVAIYSVCGGLAADQLAGSCSDGNGGENVTVNGLAAGTYYVRVWSDGSAPAPPTNGRVEGTFTINADATLSVNSVENQNAFTYFPNPVKNELTLNAQNDIQNVAIYNMLGQEVLRTVPNSNNSTIDMNGFSQGAYFVQVTIGNVTETVRVIKQ